VEPAERFLGWRATRWNILAAFSLRCISQVLRAGVSRAWRLATAAAASVFASRVAAMAASGIASAAAALAWPARLMQFFLLAYAIARGKGNFKLVQLVPLFLGTLVIGNRQQGLQATTRRGVLRFSHRGIIPLAGLGEHIDQHTHQLVMRR
jgi:hypothetical protein